MNKAKDVPSRTISSKVPIERKLNPTSRRIEHEAIAIWTAVPQGSGHRFESLQLNSF
jgi:hypothetical protein